MALFQRVIFKLTGKDLPRGLVKHADFLDPFRKFEFIRSVERLRSLQMLTTIQSDSTTSSQSGVNTLRNPAVF